jgi:hypothetical protein
MASNQIAETEKLVLNIGKPETKTYLDGIECYEIVNIETLDRLINSKLLIGTFHNKYTGDMYENEKEQLMEYKKNMVNGWRDGNLVKIKVKYILSKVGYGRVAPEKSLGLINIRREVRHTLAKDIWIDLDIANAQPQMLLQICKANGIVCDKLEEYCNHRDEYLGNIMTHYGINRDEAKKLIVRMMFFGDYETWISEKNFGEIPQIQNIIDLTAQLKQIGKRIVEANPLLVKERERVEKQNAKNKKKKNKIGSVVSYYLQEWENRVLEVLVEYCKEKGMIVGNVVSLCYDGLMIMKEKFTPQMLIDFNEVVKRKIGFDLVFTTKDFDMDMTEQLNEEAVSISDFEFDEEYMENLDKDYMATLPTYELKKKYFEIFVCKVEKPSPIYVQTYRDVERNITQLYIMKKEELFETFCEVKSNTYDAQKNNIPFCVVWRVDESIKRYDTLDFTPYNGIFEGNDKNKSKKFNLFTGYNREVLEYEGYKYHEDGSLKTEEEIMESDFKLLNPYYKLLTQLCGGNPSHANYLKRYLSHIVQRPATKMPVAIIIKGKQGTGKNTMLMPIEKIICSEHFITSSNPNDFFGEHAEGFYHKLLVNMNEMEGKDGFDFDSKLKSFISEDTITINPKYQRPTKVNNYCRLLIFSNKPNPIVLDVMGSDRRYVVFESSDFFLELDSKGKKKYAMKWWSGLRDHMNSIEFLSALYRDLCAEKLDTWDFIRTRPITEAYKAMYKKYIPVEVNFFGEFIEQCEFERKCRFDIVKGGVAIDDKFLDPETIIHKEDCDNYNVEKYYIGEEIFKEFKKWCVKNGYSKIEGYTNAGGFYNKIENLKIPMNDVKHNGYKCLKFNPCSVYEYMIEKRWIMRNDEDFIAMETERNGGAGEDDEEQEEEEEGLDFDMDL